MRQRGGFITTTPLTFSTSSASGVFTINDAAILRSAMQWPRGPLAPTSLTALSDNAQLSLSWVAPATTHGTITNYLVEYTASGGSAAYVLTNSNGNSYTLTGLTNGTSYSVRVAAVNFTAGDYSTTATATPNAVQLPSAPTNLRILPSNYNQTKFAWDPPVNNGGSAITGYHITERGDLTSPNNPVAATEITLNHTHCFSFGGNYIRETAGIAVRAINIAGQGAAASIQSTWNWCTD
jgi:hypothetical protein